MYRKILGRTPSEQSEQSERRPRGRKMFFSSRVGVTRRERRVTTITQLRGSAPARHIPVCMHAVTVAIRSRVAQVYRKHPSSAARSRAVPCPCWEGRTPARDQTKRLPPGGFAVIPSPTEGKVAARSFDRADG